MILRDALTKEEVWSLGIPPWGKGGVATGLENGGGDVAPVE
ncbi:MAG: hypothetical protein ACT4OT_14420 [Acidobacteriota bacterium]